MGSGCRFMCFRIYGFRLMGFMRRRVRVPVRGLGDSVQRLRVYRFTRGVGDFHQE